MHRSLVPFALALSWSPLALAHPLDDLEPGHWMVVSTNTIADVDPCPTQDCSYSAVEGISGLIDDWNGGALASGYGELGGLVVWGGGHNGYFGSEVYVFDIAAQAWVRASDPYDNGGESVAPDCSAQGIYPDGSACPAHTYDRVDYHPGTNSFVIMSGTPDPVCGGCDDNLVHLFDLDDGSWSLGAAIPSPQPVTGAQSAYDGTRDVFWFLGAYSYPPLRRYDPNADAWTVHGDVVQPIEIDGAALHDPVHDAFLYLDPLGSQDLYAFDLADPDAPSIALAVEGDVDVLGRDKVGFEWDPVQGRIVAWDDGADVYVIDPPDGDWKSGTWTATRFAPAETNEVVPARGINGTYSRFRYVPSVNAFVVVSFADGPVWGYKASDEPGTGPNGEDTGGSSGADDGATSSVDDGGSEGASASATADATGAGDDGPGDDAADDAPGDTSSAGASAADDDDAAGCGCRSGGRSGRESGGLGLLALAMLGLGVRRRQSSTSTSARAFASQT